MQKQPKIHNKSRSSIVYRTLIRPLYNTSVVHIRGIVRECLANKRFGYYCNLFVLLNLSSSSH